MSDYSIVPNRAAARSLILAALALLFLVIVPGRDILAQDNDDCYACHEDKDLRGELKGRSRSMFVDQRLLRKSVHAEFE